MLEKLLNALFGKSSPEKPAAKKPAAKETSS